MTKKNIMPVAVLTLICVIVAALLAVVNYFTAPTIEENEEQKKYDSLREVLDGTFEPTELPEGAAESVNAIYKVKDKSGKLIGHVATVTVKGYKSDISVTVGVDTDGKVTKAVVTNEAESHGKGGMATYTDRFAGKDATEVAEAELFSGATVSSTAIRGAVLDAVNTVLGNSTPEEPEAQLPKTDEEILALALELNSKFTDLTLLEAEGVSEFVKRIYKSADGYFAYIVTNTEWNPLETELAVAFDGTGKVIATKLLAWNLSPTYEHNDIKGDSFVAGLAGKDQTSLENVELITHVTETSGRVREAVLSVSKLFSLPTSEAEIAEIAGELLNKDVTLENITPDAITDMVKRLYLASDGSYVAYIITYTEWNKHEAELVVTLNENGKVTGTKLLAWNLSPTYEHNDIKGDTFVESLVGKDDTTLPSVELITHVTETSGRFRDTVLAVSKLLSLPTPESEIAEIAGELLDTTVTLENVTPSDISDMVKRLYKASDGSYAAYIVTYTEWNKHESELVITLNSKGKVTGAKLLAWNLSPTYEHNDIKGDAFVESLVGKNQAALENVELITHVTETSGRVRANVIAASEAVTLLAPEGDTSYLPRIIGIAALAASAILVAALVVIYKRKRRIGDEK